MFPRDQPDEIVLSSGEFSSHLGEVWNFNMEGFGFSVPDSPPGNFIGESYYEITVDYSVDLEIIFDAPPGEAINANFSNYDTNDPKTGHLRLGGKSAVSTGDGLTLYSSIFNLDNVQPVKRPPKTLKEEEIETPWFVWLLLAIMLAVLAVLFYRKYQKDKKEENE
jgi:hypothetical protein